jgi:hypothetical protein
MPSSCLSYPGPDAGEQLADEWGVLVLHEASRGPAIAKIISNFGSPFGSLTIISSSEQQWAQQGSNLRPLACKASSYRRWTWLDVARCGICQPRLWLDVAWRGLMPVDVRTPFGSPSSLAPLTFSNRILPRSSERGEAGSSPSVGGRRSARCLLRTMNDGCPESAVSQPIQVMSKIRMISEASSAWKVSSP